MDDSLVKEYFPVSVVVSAILDIYQNLLGVRFQEIKDKDVWHPGKMGIAIFLFYFIYLFLIFNPAIYLLNV